MTTRTRLVVNIKPSRFNERMMYRINYSNSLCSEFHQYDNDTDLGMKSSGGLRPPKISSKEARSPEKGQQLKMSYEKSLMFVSTNNQGCIK